MLFNSLDYIAFLTLTLLGFWALRRWGPERDEVTSADGKRQVTVRGAGLRLAFLFLASCVFYMAWNPTYIVLMLGSTVLDYVVGLGIGATESQRKKKAWLAVSMAGNLGLLGVFKYYNFFATATGDALTWLLGVDAHLPLLNVLLPVGISFYTFQTLSYSIDVYRGQLKPTRDFIQFAFYVTFFPQLVAGPIVRAAEFLPQVTRPPWLTKERVGHALFLIALGLAKKIIFADFISVNLVDRVFDDPAAFSSAEVVLGLYGFTLQIYADFSGYTDVARGSGMLFGYDLPENFDRPYQAKSVAEFWRRWHMTLSTWLRDYLYFPLGGSKRGTARTYFNLWLTIFLIGLWHGASWTFVIYGNLQACAVMLNRFLEQSRKPSASSSPIASVLRAITWPWNALVRAAKKKDGRDPVWLNVLRVALTMQFVVFSRILFRASDLDNAGAIVHQLGARTMSVAQVGDDVWRVLVLGFYLHYGPRSQLAWARTRFVGLPAWGQGLVLVVVAAVLALFVTGGVVPYIYFQF